MREYEAGIIQIEQCGPSVYHILVECSDLARLAAPGQFVQVRIGDGTDPFLRRTFSLCGAEPQAGMVHLMVDAVGRGTSLLCSMNKGDTLNLIGPLGNGFKTTLGGKTPCVLVAGGVGVAPLLFLADRLDFLGKREVILMVGARNDEQLSMVDGHIPEDVNVMFATEDGSWEYKGLVTELLGNRLSEFNPGAIYTCGPQPMMKKVAEIAGRAGIPCQVSLEERMACGIGACLGCAAPLADGSMGRVCKDGPVFHAGEVAW